MSDGDKPDAKPTLVSAEVPLGTMQMRPGAPTDETAAPLMPTQMPTTAAALPPSAPPAMPAEWRYTLTSEIARGGMGRVVEAIDSVLGRTVALKEVLSLDTETVRRFQRETRITARLEHPAIVPVHDAGTTPSGAPFYVMRKIGGRALEELVARATTVPERLALVPHVVQAANAIAHAHERGIVHRDIKPANILCGELGETIVIDWGLAKAIGEDEDAAGPVQRVLDEDESDTIKTRAGIVFGTPGFMAPEQLRGRPVDERCDVYALGATLYHLLARRPPHHHKNADVMMRAAVDGPPIPLLELVPEIPPELATIVDKALAHDANKRYPDARALAEDLQAYLTGKLVGSHQYTARERLARFVKQNRAAVMIAAIAAVTGLAGATFGFIRIRDERDRADEQATLAIAEKRAADTQRDEVLKKSRELVLANARHASATEPTRSLAMIKPLALPAADAMGPSLWREARDVAAAARANGVAFSIPVSKHTLSLELSRDGGRALTAGDDGIVRIVDIDKRKSQELANVGGEVMARFADGERTIVLYQGNRLTIIDTATNAKREVTTPTAITKLEIAGPLAYWVDAASAVWRLDLAGGPPMKIELTEPINLVCPSPDGRWIAYGGKQHLLLSDRSDPTRPPENKSEGEVHLAVWSSDSKHLAVQIDDEVIDLNMQPTPQIWNRYRVGQRYGLAFSGGRVFSTGPRGVSQLFSPEPKIRIQDPGHTLGVHEGRENVVISAKPQGEIAVLSDYGDHVLRAPLPIEMVATSARGPWIVAAAEGMLLVWSLDHFEPRSFASYPPSSARFVTGDTMIVTYQNESADWIDLRTGKATSLGELPALVTVTAAPDGAEAVGIDLTRQAWRIAGIGKPQALPGEVDAAAYVDNTHLVLAGDGKVRVEDVAQQTKVVLFEYKAALRDLATAWNDGGWVAASFADGLVWRKQLRGGEGRLTIPVAPAAPLALAADGTLVIGAGKEVRAWRPDGKIDVIATLDLPIVGLTLIEPSVALATTSTGGGVVIDLRAKQVRAQITYSEHASIAADGSLAAGPTPIGGVEVIDPAVSWSWPLASPQKGASQEFSQVQVARDGSAVLALTQDAVVVWPLELPADQSETKDWLDKTTNATADSPSRPLGWR